MRTTYIEILSGILKNSTLSAREIAEKASAIVSPDKVPNVLAKLRQMTSPRIKEPVFIATPSKDGMLYSIDNAACGVFKKDKRIEATIVYVDASYHIGRGKAGVGVWIPSKGIGYALPVPAKSAEEAEVYAMQLAIALCELFDIEEVLIYSDCQRAISKMLELSKASGKLFTLGMKSVSKISFAWEPRENMMIPDALARIGRKYSFQISLHDGLGYGQALERLKSFCGGVSSRLYSAAGIKDGEFFDEHSPEGLQRAFEKIADAPFKTSKLELEFELEREAYVPQSRSSQVGRNFSWGGAVLS